MQTLRDLAANIALTTIENYKKQNDNTKTPPKTSIIQRLRTDWERLIGVTTATQLVWLNYRCLNYNTLSTNIAKNGGSDS